MDGYTNAISWQTFLALLIRIPLYTDFAVFFAIITEFNICYEKKYVRIVFVYMLHGVSGVIIPFACKQQLFSFPCFVLSTFSMHNCGWCHCVIVIYST